MFVAVLVYSFPLVSQNTVSPSKRSFPWPTKEQIALVQFVALFGELKKESSEWPTLDNRHEHWDKAAAFVQDTAGG